MDIISGLAIQATAAATTVPERSVLARRRKSELQSGMVDKPARYADREDLLPRLQAVLAVRQVQVTRYTGGSIHHQDCHCRARRQLRDPKTLHRLALVRQHTRLTQLIGEREAILNRLVKLDDEVSILQHQIASLELSGLMIDAGPSGQLAASRFLVGAID